jgi:raffinose/stachyose/melibiose transport system permease protein
MMAASAPVIPSQSATERLRRSINRAQPSAYLFLLPALLFYVTFRLYPYVQTFWLGLHDWNGMTAPRWVGLGNYAEALQDPYFWRATYQTLAFMAIDITLPLTVALTLAVLVSEVTRGRVFFRIALFTPYVLSAAVVSVMWKMIYSPNIGIVNSGFRAIGLGQFAHPWLGDSQYALPAVALANSWHSYGFAFVVFLAAIQSIDTSLYEAARLDGASWLQLQRHVTIPGLRNAITLLVSLAVAGALAAFTFIYIMTGGGPNFATEVLSTYVYDKGFLESRYGYASALSVAMALFALTISALFIWLRERGD